MEVIDFLLIVAEVVANLNPAYPPNSWIEMVVREVKKFNIYHILAIVIKL